MKQIVPILLLLSAVVLLACAVRSKMRRGEYDHILKWWRGSTFRTKILAVLMLVSAMAYSSDKRLGELIDTNLVSATRGAVTICTNAFHAIGQLTGYIVSSVATNETHDFTPPSSATVAERIARRGAHNDGFWLFDDFTNTFARAGLSHENQVWAHSDGTVTVRSPAPGIPIEEVALYTTYANITIYAPLQGTYGFLPASLWPNFQPSRIWTAVTDSGTRVITWENALLDRDPSSPVSFQAEFHPNGDITYRYSSTPPITNSPTSIGLFRNNTPNVISSAASAGLDYLTQSPLSSQSFHGNLSTLQPFNLSTIHWSYIGDLGDGTGDTDGDGLTDWQEIMETHTDPHRADTDGDGLSDWDEAGGGTDPNDPDTDGDGIPDGQDISTWASHPLWADSTNANFTVCMTNADVSAKAVVRVGDLAFLLQGTNSASLHLQPGVFYEVNYATADDRPHALVATFSGLEASGLRGGAGTGYGWRVDDEGGIFSGGPRRSGSANVALVTLELVPRGWQCVHDGPGCFFDVVMAPDDWANAKAHADLDNLELQSDGSLLLPVPQIPGTYVDGVLILGYPYFREGFIGRTVEAHRCEGWSGYHCPICGTYHYDGNGCDHEPGCAAGHSPPGECDCEPIQVPFNCDDDDEDGTEDRLQQGLAIGEDDLAGFSPIRADAAYCCCGIVYFPVVVNSVSGNLRLWQDGRLLGPGSVSDYGSWQVEGVATNNAGGTSSITYTVLDWNDRPIKTITRKFVVSPSVSFSFDSDSVLPDGKVVVVKRSTDPVRINNSTATVHATGLANGTYRLVADGARFHNNDLTISTVELDGGTGDSNIYGDLPSSTMGDATLSLQTIGGTTLCTTNFTVLWVEISMRCGQDEPFSADNGRTAFPNNTMYLGKQVFLPQLVSTNGVTATTEGGIGNVVEMVGVVRPTDFSGIIRFARDSIDEYAAAFTPSGLLIRTYSSIRGKARGPEPPGNDPTYVEFQDRDPLPNGRVYDIDTPGFLLDYAALLPFGTFVVMRVNFLQYVTFSDRRCSNDFAWHSKTTIRREENAGNPCFTFFTRPSFPDDNSCGPGHSTTAP